MRQRAIIRCGPRVRRPCRGVAVIVALIMLALLAGFSTAVIKRNVGFRRYLHRAHERHQAAYLAQSAVQEAIHRAALDSDATSTSRRIGSGRAEATLTSPSATPGTWIIEAIGVAGLDEPDPTRVTMRVRVDRMQALERAPGR